MSPEESPREEPAASKRRRSHEDNETDEGPPGKRIASAANDVAEALGAQLRLREERRAELRAVYANYGTLLTGTDTGSEALAFQGLLDCAQGSCGARRLAARLVPRFLPRFPGHVEPAARLLMSLYSAGPGAASPPTPPSAHRHAAPNGLPKCSSPSPDTPTASPTTDQDKGTAAVAAGGVSGAGARGPVSGGGGADADDPSLVEAMRRDALLGLGNVLEAAVRHADRNIPLVMELVNFLLRHSQHLSTESACQSDGREDGGMQGDGVGYKSQVKGQGQGHQAEGDKDGCRGRHRRGSSTGLKGEGQEGGGGGQVGQGHRAPDAMDHDRMKHGQGPGDGAGQPGGTASANGGSQHHHRHQPRQEGDGGRRSSRDGSSSRDAAGPSAAKHEPPGDGCLPAPAPVDPDPSCEAGVVRGLLLRAFCLFPRVLLAACLQPFRLAPRQRVEADCRARLGLMALLLRPGTGTAGAGAAGAAQAGAGALAVKAGKLQPSSPHALRQPEGGPVCSPPSAAPAPPAPGCLAQRVLSHLPDTQAWLRQVAAAVLAGKSSPPIPPELRDHLHQLLSYCTATAATPGAAPAGGDGLHASPKTSPGHAVAGPGAAAGAGAGHRAAGAAAQGPHRPGSGLAASGGAADGTGPQPSVAAATGIGGGGTHSALGSEEGSRSVPMDLDNSVSTSIRQEAQHLAHSQHTQHHQQPPPPPPHPAPAADSTPAHTPASTRTPGAAAAAPWQATPAHTPAAAAAAPAGSSGPQLRGGSVCCAEACLYLSHLPQGLPEGSLLAELGRLGRVEAVHPARQVEGAQGGGPGGAQGEGEACYVVFSSLRDAAMAFEAIAGTCPFGGTRPLHAEFCCAFPPDSAAARRRAAAGPAAVTSQFVWLSAGARVVPGAGAGPAPAPVTHECATGALRAAGLPQPRQILAVQGRAPGWLLQMEEPGLVPGTVACLHQAIVAPALAAAAQAAQAAAAAQAQSSQAAGGQQAAAGLGGAAAGQGGGGPAAATATAAAAELPHMRTLWIGQLHESVTDDQLRAACPTLGEVLLVHRMRSTRCAYVDFATAAGAEAARRALHGLRLGPCHLRVEHKQTDSRGGMRRPPPLGPPGGGAGSTPGPGVAGTPPTPYGHGGTPLMGMSPMAGGQPGTPFGGAVGPMPLPPQPPHGAGLAAPRSVSGPMGPGGPAGLHMRAGSAPLTPLQAQQQHAAMMMGGYGGGGPGRMVSPHPHPHPHPHGHPGAMHGYPGGQMQAGGAYAGASPAHPTQHHTHHQQQHHHQGHSGGGGVGSGAALHGPDSGPLPPLPSEPPPPPPPPLPGGHEPAASAPATWHGGLAKSGVPHCTLVCRQGGATGPGASPSDREPVGWPPTLDVTLRMPLRTALQVYANVPQQHRSLRVLLPAEGSGAEGLVRFNVYLDDKERAGVIKLDPHPGALLPARTLYLLPPSRPACEALGLLGPEWSGGGAVPRLLALVVPSAAAGGGKEPHGTAAGRR